MQIIVRQHQNYGNAFAQLNDIIQLNQMGSNGIPVFTYQLDPVKRSIDIQLQDQNYIMNSVTMHKFHAWMNVFSI